MKENIIMILFTSAVIASFVTSVANIIIAIINNHRLKLIEKEKQKNVLTAYRYKCLHEMLLKWQEYDTPVEMEGKELSQIAEERIHNSFLDNSRKFQIISPLMDQKYKENIEKINEKGKNLLSELIDIEKKLGKNSSEELRLEYERLFVIYMEVASNYTTELEKTINLQLEELLKTIE